LQLIFLRQQTSTQFSTWFTANGTVDHSHKLSNFASRLHFSPPSCFFLTNFHLIKPKVLKQFSSNATVDLELKQEKVFQLLGECRVKVRKKRNKTNMTDFLSHPSNHPIYGPSCVRERGLKQTLIKKIVIAPFIIKTSQIRIKIK
jgi:hypothetical protein